MSSDTSLRQQNEEALRNPAVRNFLNAIASAEGTDTYNYATGFGGSQLPSLADHPRTREAFRDTTGKRNYTTAAGRYQITAPTWDALSKKNGSTAFEPYEQDLAAVQLLREKGALDALLKGDTAAATRAAGEVWAALPTSTAPQTKQGGTEWARLLARNATTLPSEDSSALQSAAHTIAGAPAFTATIAVPVAAPTPLFQPVPQAAIAPTVPEWAASLTNAMAQARVPDTAGPEEQDIDDWRDTLIKQNVAQEADLNRQEAVSQFLGEPPVKRYTLPDAIERAILRALGTG